VSFSPHLIVRSTPRANSSRIRSPSKNRTRTPISLALVGLSDLSAREKTVFELVVRGLRNRQIGEELCITERTVKSHVGNLLAKCGCSSRAELLAVCLSRALGIESEPNNEATRGRQAVRRRESQRKRRERDAEVTRRQAMAMAEAEAQRAGTGKRSRSIARLIAWEKVFGQRSHAPAP
jgi:DNA-binding CsgD family transcriptional regulator